MNHPRFLDESFEMVCNKLLQIFIKKHKDYGKENILEIGELGIAFRINEKVSRLKNLITSNKKPVNENIEDSWYDIAVYAIIAMLYKKGYFQKLDLSPKNKK